MPTKHDPPRPSQGETTKRGRVARKPGQTRRQRGVDPKKLRVVAEMMAGGVDYYDMQRMLSERWNVSMRTIRAYRDRVLGEMRDELQDAGFLDGELEKVLGVRRLEEVYLAAMAAKDFRAVTNIIKLRLQVVGVLGPARVEHSFPEGVPIGAVVAAAPSTPAEAASQAKLGLAKWLARKMAAKSVDDPPAAG